MENMLIINAHPRVESTTSVSLQVLQHFLEAYTTWNPAGAIEQIDLYRDSIPAIDHMILELRSKQGRGVPLNEEEHRLTDRMSAILQQFKAAWKYVIVMPMHNFNVPSKLKDYIDNILIARETFQYTEKGSEGLLTDGRSLLVIQASDAIYTNNDWYTEVEYSHKYLKSMFNFMGVMDYQIIRAQGNAFFDRDQVLAQAFQEAEEAAKRLAGKKVETSVSKER
ncbi:FMN-dependent NADH-azoreductase [Paenibacillus sp. MDMC362]|uniref:FMN-dependent NADH-azoreductase n=1 Tax=Paenibacillus sp. MDMC362 TaxID=2977365 RepID=UPI000DC2F428|nr:NAD(P)H-dependent oxidoreductase [Paenibacillus sp. MDMC362]RAR44238.1 FMN-dependent NADH-azoreductase [Paenibacillus sp. MDMC362]